MDQQDPEERVAELERELAEAKAAVWEQQRPAPQAYTGELTAPPRRIPAKFVLAEILPFRWWYVWTLFMVAVTPIVVWIYASWAFAIAAPVTLLLIYAFQARGAATRLSLLKWGVPANVIGSEVLSRGTYYSGTTYYNVYLPVAHGWTVTRERWSGPSTKTTVRYALDGYRGELVLRGRAYSDGVILADQRNPARALCVSSFAYDLDRNPSGDWVGRLRPRLVMGMVAWALIVAAWLAAAVLIVAAPGLTGGGPLTVPSGGSLRVGGNSETKTVVCNGGNLQVGGNDNTVTVTGHCARLSVSGNGNHVTIDEADTIIASGISNVVTYHSGTPRITRSGISTSVDQG
jgi:hypothetical protein